MKKINKPGDNLGGLLKIWALPVSSYYMDASGIHIVSDVNVYQIYCSPDSMEFSEVSEISGSGKHYNSTISGFIPNDNAALQEAIAYLEPLKWNILYIDGNGFFKLAGSISDPLRLSGSFESGKDTSSPAGFLFRFSGLTKNRAVFAQDPF